MKITLIIIGLMLAGCTNHTSKELLILEVTKPDKTEIRLLYRPEMTMGSLLSITEVKDVEHVTATTSTVIGEINTASDPNSINEVSEGVLSGLFELILK
jgi:hypothetical protein